MHNEAATGSAGTPERRGYPRGSSGEQSPLQARAAFLKNRSWELVVGLNQGACARGSAQHGKNSESYAATEAAWRQTQTEVSSLGETIEFLRQCHRRAPFFSSTVILSRTLDAPSWTLFSPNCPPLAAAKSCLPSRTI